jgi:hypothetical protein
VDIQRVLSEVIVRVLVNLSCLALASAAVLVSAPANAAPPTPPACGSTITADTALRADLVCGGPGLVLAAGVDLDLRGHTIRGTAGGVGLAVSPSGDSVIKNGTLSGWGTAVRTLVDLDGPGGAPLIIDRISFTNNGRGVDGTGALGFGAKDVTVTRSSFTNHSGSAISATFNAARIDHTTFADNAVGYSGDTGSSAVVTHSRFVRNARAFVISEAAATVERSTFVDNPQAIVTLGLVNGLTLTDSRIIGSDVGVNGLYAASRITGSTFVANATAVVVGMYGATLTSNTFRANEATLAFVGQDSGAVTVVQDNTFRRNGDGLLVDSPEAHVSIGGNDARKNAGWGIYAPGATDLGGNTAKHNGNQPQCVGVVCP